MKKQLLVLLLATFSCNLLGQTKLAITKDAPSGIPAAVQQWLDGELAKAKKKDLIDLKSDGFFTRDTARLVGYIKGYHRGLGFSTGMVYAGNLLTTESFPKIVTIHEDGRFEVDIPMNHPIYTYALMEGKPLPFYIEPGQTLSIALDWDEFLKADKTQNRRFEFKNLLFAGPLGRINDEVLKFKPDEPDHGVLNSRIRNETPSTFNTKHMEYWKASVAQLEDVLKKGDLTEQSKIILRNGLLVSNAAYLFDYLLKRESAIRTDSTDNAALKAPINPDYYAFLHEMPLNDQTLLISRHFSTFINRFEFSRPFTEPAFKLRPATRKPFHTFLFHELKLVPTQADQDFMEFLNEKNKSLAAIKGDQRATVFREISAATGGFSQKYKEYVPQYNEKHPDNRRQWYIDYSLAMWTVKDSVLKDFYKLQPNLVYEITKVRMLSSYFNQMLKGQKDDARTVLTGLEKGIEHPFLLDESEKYFNQSYPAVAATTYDLPISKGAEIFKKIIDQYKGKMLFVDFWATTCGPCIASIKQNKETRAKLKDDKDFDFIFITSDRESPQKRYDEFIKEQDLVKTFRLSDDDFKHLRQLFNFNGIPRYVLIDKEGRVADDDFPMYALESELPMLAARLKNKITN